MDSSAALTVVIPCRVPGDAGVTLRSLGCQTMQDFKIILQADYGKGANWARNKGFEQVQTEFVLFSDDDIDWQPFALELLLRTLKAHPEASYSYGAYEMDGWIQCDREFDAAALSAGNYISTMSLIRSKDFPGFDESVLRLQDWDLWLRMLEMGRTGVYCGRVVFHTARRAGITYGSNGPTWQEAVRAIRARHAIPCSPDEIG